MSNTGEVAFVTVGVLAMLWWHRHLLVGEAGGSAGDRMTPMDSCAPAEPLDLRETRSVIPYVAGWNHGEPTSGRSLCRSLDTSGS